MISISVAWIGSALSCFRKALTTNRTFVHVHFTKDKDKAKVTNKGPHIWHARICIHLLSTCLCVIPCTQKTHHTKNATIDIDHAES